MHILLIAVCLLGHLALWVALFNRLHAFPVPCRAIRLTELAVVGIAAGGAAWVVHQTWVQPTWLIDVWFTSPDGRYLPMAYAAVCCLVALWIAVRWFQRRGWMAPSTHVLANHTEHVDVAAELDESLMRGWSTRLFACLPMNQMFNLCLHEKSVELPRLPATLEGLSILHLSDLHFTGKVTRPFFDYVIRRSNEFDADLVAITGDILEHEDCYAWLPETLGQLHSRDGVYFILGNHDRRVRDVRRLRDSLTGLGLHDLGSASRWVQVRDESLLLTGNELPWFGPPPQREPAPDVPVALRILLSHSPDQIPWARRHDFDLMLAGHTHGGHIRIPLIGPVVCPSRFGVKFASGMFYEHPTLLHVSRGISGLDPVRFNCPPELTKLVLRTPRGRGTVV